MISDAILITSLIFLLLGLKSVRKIKIIIIIKLNFHNNKTFFFYLIKNKNNKIFYNQFNILFIIFIIFNIISVIIVDIIFTFIYSSTNNPTKLGRLKMNLENSNNPEMASISNDDIRTLLKLDSVTIIFSNTFYTFSCVSF